MKILDFHIHIGRSDQLTPWIIEHFKETFSPEIMTLLDQITPQFLSDLFGRQGVDKALVLAEISPKTTGRIPSDYIADFCKGSDRFIPAGSIDLESDINPGLQTETCIKELGCRAIKLYPPYVHLFPDDPHILPVYEVAQGLDVPVMFHTGTSLFPGSRMKYANPLLLDEVAEDFPGLKIVMCHAGRPFWYKEAQWMLMRHKNTYIDISGIPIRQLADIFPKFDKLWDRFMFGSDWPQIPSIESHYKKFLQLPFSDEIKRAVLWDNGMRLLGLE